MSKRRHSGRVARPSLLAGQASPAFSLNPFIAALFGLTLGAAAATPTWAQQEAGVKTLPTVTVTGQAEAQ